MSSRFGSAAFQFNGHARRARSGLQRAQLTIKKAVQYYIYFINLHLLKYAYKMFYCLPDCSQRSTPILSDVIMSHDHSRFQSWRCLPPQQSVGLLLPCPGQRLGVIVDVGLGALQHIPPQRSLASGMRLTRGRTSPINKLLGEPRELRPAPHHSCCA